MTLSVPQIGFDRFIQREWVAAALKARAGACALEELNELLDAAGLGLAARKKTRTVLNRLWLEPRPELANYADRGVAIFSADPSVSASILSWGMAISTYPFFGKVAELVGRLSALQGDCASAEVHRRMSEMYGEREGTYRMTNMVLQTQSDWGAIERVEKGKRLVRRTPIPLNNDQVVAWLIEGALRYVGKAVPVTTLQSLAVIYPFALNHAPAYILSQSPELEMRTLGGGDQFVSIYKVA